MTSPACIYDLLVCPYDRQPLEVFVQVDSMTNRDVGCLHNPRTKQLWAVVDGIPRFVGPGNIDLDIDIDVIKKARETFPAIPHNSAEQTITKLTEWNSPSVVGWERQEMLFWEQYYANKLTEHDDAWAVSYNRLIPRQRHILSKLPNDVQTVLEIGCGTAGTLWRDEVFIADRMYVGTDLSFNALRVARSRLEGFYVLCDVNAMPFRDESFDAILGFGILHHLPNHEEALPGFSRYLRKGGWFGFTEKLKTSDKIQNSHFIRILKRIALKQERAHGELEFIDRDNLQRILQHLCPHEKHLHFDYSIIRDALVLLIVDTLRINSRLIAQLIISIDNLAVRLFSEVSDLFAPKNVTFVARKD